MPVDPKGPLFAWVDGAALEVPITGGGLSAACARESPSNTASITRLSASHVASGEESAREPYIVNGPTIRARGRVPLVSALALCSLGLALQLLRDPRTDNSDLRWPVQPYTLPHHPRSPLPHHPRSARMRSLCTHIDQDASNVLALGSLQPLPAGSPTMSQAPSIQAAQSAFKQLSDAHLPFCQSSLQRPSELPNEFGVHLTLGAPSVLQPRPPRHHPTPACQPSCSSSSSSRCDPCRRLPHRWPLPQPSCRTRAALPPARGRCPSSSGARGGSRPGRLRTCGRCCSAKPPLSRTAAMGLCRAGLATGRPASTARSGWGRARPRRCSPRSLSRLQSRCRTCRPPRRGRCGAPRPQGRIPLTKGAVLGVPSGALAPTGQGNESHGLAH